MEAHSIQHLISTPQNSVTKGKESRRDGHSQEDPTCQLNVICYPR